MPAINVDSLLNEDALNERDKGRPYRFGYNHFVNYSPDNSGNWTSLSDGDRIWQLDVKTAGSYTLNLAFSNFHLPAGAKLFVYSKDHAQLLGGFTDANNTPDNFFGTELINGDEAVIEYYEPAQAQGQGHFTLFRITQGYRDIHNYLKSFGQAGSCLHNVNCPQYADYATQKRAVVCLVSGGNEFCSGSLINNTLNDGTPYVLTANHCGTADGTWIFRFNWESPGCPNPITNPSTAQSISGGTPIAQSGVSDFNLVKMSTAPPAGYHAFYAGWNRSVTPATSVTAIHHPSGDIKKCSKANNTVTATFYNAGNGTALVWQIGQWTDGCTEAGSSGSPLFDQSKRIVGQLYGGPSACGETPANLIDYYGRFCVSWDSGATPQTRLRDWLDPANTNPLTNDGYDPNPPQNNLDAALSAIVSPASSTCNNSISPAITVQNAGSDAISSLFVAYTIDANTPVVYQWTGLLLSLQSTTITLPQTNMPSGNHLFHAIISQPNGLSDQNASNDSANASFTITIPTTINLPAMEGFEEGSFPPVTWTITTPVSGTTWKQATVGGYGASGHSAKVDEFSPITSTAGEQPDLITPSINMSITSTPARMFFDVAYAAYDARHSDSLAVLASTDCGTTWTRIYARDGLSLATAPNSTTAFVPTSAQWRTDTINISAYAGQPSVQFDFQLISGYGNIVYIDNINIAGTQPSFVDAGVNNLTSPLPSTCDTQIIASFNLENYGTDTLTSATIYYSFDGAIATTYPWTGLLTQGQSTAITLPVQALTVGNHSLRIFSSGPNSTQDQNHTNDTLFLNFTTGQKPILNLTSHASHCGADTLIANVQEATFLWSTDEYTAQILATTPGYYSVTVTTTSQCSVTASVYATVPGLPLVTLHLPVDSACLPAGMIPLGGGNPAGGSYTVNAVTETSFDASHAVAGTYPVYYSYNDSNGCVSNTYQNLEIYSCTGIQETGQISSVRLFPNPFTENFNLQFTLDAPQTIDAGLYAVDGKKLVTVFNNDMISAGLHQQQINTHQLSNGIYILKVNERYFKIEKLK